MINWNDNWNDFLLAAAQPPNFTDGLEITSPDVLHASRVLSSAFTQFQQSDVLHIHIVGDKKSGKTITAKWLTELLPLSRQESIIGETVTSYTITIPSTANIGSSQIHSSQRGVVTTVIQYQSKRYRYNKRDNTFIETIPKHYMIMIYDYGGPEEFLAFHTTFTDIHNSIYMILIPLLEISHDDENSGSNYDKRKIRSIHDMTERYLYWCRLIYTLLPKPHVLPHMNTCSSSTGTTTAPAGGGIPIISLINSFKQYCVGDIYEIHIANAITAIERQFSSHFTYSIDINNKQCDFIIPSRYDDDTRVYKDSLLIITDNAINQDILMIIHLIQRIYDNTTVNGDYRKTAMIDFIMKRLDNGILPLLMTERDWKEWLRDQVGSFPFTPSLDYDNLLSSQQQDEFIDVLSNYCEYTLHNMHKILVLSQCIQGYSVIVNPSVLYMNIASDLLLLYDDEINPTIDTLLMTQESILQRINVMRKLENNSNNSNKMIKLKTNEDLLQSMPLVELLNNTGFGIQIYHEQTQSIQSWFIAYASDLLPHNLQLLRYDWWPDHEIRRYYRLTHTKACIIPTYFLRLFVSMSNKGYIIQQLYGNAVKMKKMITTGGGKLQCEIQILICQLSDRDCDGLVITIAGKGEQSMAHSFRELNTLRSFVYGYSRDIMPLEEYCLPLNVLSSTSDRKRLREDLLHGEKSISAIIPHLFGIPQYVENYYEDEVPLRYSTERGRLAKLVLEECLAVRRYWKEWFFGGTPRLPAKPLSMRLEDGHLKLRKEFLTSFGIENISSNIVQPSGNKEDYMYLRMDLSDIFQHYSTLSYDKELHTVAQSASNIQDLLRKLITSTIVYNVTHEVEMREILYRCLIIFFHLKYIQHPQPNQSSVTSVGSSSINNSICSISSADNSIFLAAFDSFIDKWQQESKGLFVDNLLT